MGPGWLLGLTEMLPAVGPKTEVHMLSLTKRVEFVRVAARRQSYMRY